MTTTLRERFERGCTAVVRRLPGRLSEIVAPTLLGFAVINGLSFCWLAVGGGYALALGLSFALNRALNFRTHRGVGRQLGLWVGVVVVNYAGVVVGVTVGLAALGVAYPVARIVAGLVEAAFMYSSMRWLVFRDRPVWRRR